MDAVVEGTVLRSGDRVRITAQLIEASADKHLWAQSYEGELRDTLTLQNQVARAIAEQIRISLNPQEEGALKNTKVVNPEAYVAYLKGRYFWNKRTAEGLTKAIEYFNEAIAKDPTYSQAYAGLADSYALVGNSDFAVLSARDAYPKAKAAAIKALELDNSLGEAHTSLAFCLGHFEWRWDAAEKEYRQVHHERQQRTYGLFSSFGKEMGSRPEGSTLPASTLAMASPPAVPGYQACNTPATSPIQGMNIAPPLSMTTTVRGFALATALTSASWSFAKLQRRVERFAVPLRDEHQRDITLARQFGGRGEILAAREFHLGLRRQRLDGAQRRGRVIHDGSRPAPWASDPGTALPPTG